MESLKRFIEDYTDLPEEEWAVIRDCFTAETVARGSFLLQEGEVCRSLFFLETGLLRFFLVDDKGEEVTKFFTVAPYMLTSQASFRNQTPARESIQALEDSVVYRMSRKQAYQLLKLPSWNTFVRNLISEVQGFTESILEEMQTTTAEDRYRRMLESGSPLVRRVPMKHLASFFGVAQPSLSRIRRRVLQGGS